MNFTEGCSRNQILGEGLATLSRFETDSYSRKNLLYKLILAVLTRYDIPGLDYLSSAVGRLFKSGLRRELNVQARGRTVPMVKTVHPCRV